MSLDRLRLQAPTFPERDISAPFGANPGLADFAGVAGVLSLGIFGLGFKDHTPGLPGSGAAEEGEIISSELIVLPEGTDFRGDAKWWWLNLDCPWGSSRSRFSAVIGPNPPWRKANWSRPISWIRLLKER